MKIDQSAWKDQSVVEAFLTGKRAAIPHAADQLDMMLRLLNLKDGFVGTFVDLGAGDGILSHILLDQFPASHGYLIDFSEPMLAAAQKRLEEYRDRIEIINADIAHANWQRVFADQNKQVDAVVSGYAIHHLPHDRKYELYQEIYQRLAPNGMFINIEHVASKSSWGEKLSDAAFIDTLTQYEMNQQTGRSREEIERDFQNRPDKKDNILLSVETQCEWLREIGFNCVDIYFKCFELAVFAGIKL